MDALRPRLLRWMRAGEFCRSSVMTGFKPPAGAPSVPLTYRGEAVYDDEAVEYLWLMRLGVQRGRSSPRKPPVRTLSVFLPYLTLHSYNPKTRVANAAP